MNRPLAVTAVAITLAVANVPQTSAGQLFEERDLVSDIAGRAAHLDANLANPWGIIVSSGRIRVANNLTGLSTAYSPGGIPKTPSLVIPPAGSGSPTGLVANDTESSFKVSVAGVTAKSRLIFASQDGSISAWSPDVDANAAIQVATTTDAIYMGLALGRNQSGAFLFAANFHAGTVDVFDGNFAPVSWSGAFEDPDLPDGYAPFNIANLGGRLYVAYAKQDAEREDEEVGAGFGYVNVFDTNGHLLHRSISGGVLNAPWGMVIAPGGFGDFGHALLVGNFGDGRINAYSTISGSLLGTLQDANGFPIAIEGLWGLAFSKGSGENGDDDDDDEDGEHGDDDDDGEDGEDDDHGDDNRGVLGMLGILGESRESDSEGRPTLYFAAGIDDEGHGLMGTLRPLRGGDHDGKGKHKRDALRVVTLRANPARLKDPAGVDFSVSSDTPTTVRLQIYDAAGRLVAEPVRDVAVSGTIVARWDIFDIRGAKVKAGTYYYRAIGGGNVARGRLVLLP